MCQGVQGAACCWAGDAGQLGDLTSASAVLGHVPSLVHEHGLQWQTSQRENLPLGLTIAPLTCHLEISGEDGDEQGSRGSPTQSAGGRTCQQASCDELGHTRAVRPGSRFTRDLGRDDRVEGFRSDEVHRSCAGAQANEQVGGVTGMSGLVR